MISIKPAQQIQLFGLKNFFLKLQILYINNRLPNKILLSGQKGLGKCTLAYHFINYVLSQDEDFKYDLDNLKIREENNSFKTIMNKSNPNFILIDINEEKKNIDITQIRELILNLNKSSFNNKPRFILIDNIEFLNINSINALLKILEEPNNNINFILINSNKKIFPTLFSRCINFKISLTNAESLKVADNLLGKKLFSLINNELINYYSTPGNIYRLIHFANINNYDLFKTNLKDFLITIIKNNHYKKDNSIKDLIFNLIEFYFYKINYSVLFNENDTYEYFLKRTSETQNFNLDEESLFIEIKDKILNV